jgi:lipoyl(octanoyl) transferase
MRVISLGRRPYDGIEAAMREFTAARGPDTEDELWLVEHDPVFTQGLAGRPEHVLGAGGIPVVATNRGGQVTYHGPGQVVAYPLVDLQRLGIYVKEYVYRLEQAVIQVLDGLGVTGHRVVGAPGLYVRLDDPFSHAPLAPPGPGGNPFAGLGKIAALGIKVSRHCAYHGLALNVAMDLEPFGRIDPCGYAGLATVDLRHCGVDATWDDVSARLSARLQALLQPRP